MHLHASPARPPSLPNGSRPIATTDPPRPARVADHEHLGVAAVRWVLGVAMVAVLPLAADVPLTDRLAFGYALAFGWVPVTGLLVARRQRGSGVALDVVSAAIDAAPFAAALWLLPSLQLYASAGLLVVVVYWAFTGPRRVSWTVGALVAGTLLTAGATTGGPVLSSLPAAAGLVVAVVAMLWLATSAQASRSLARRRASQAHARSGAVLTGVAEAIVITTPGGTVREWNRAAERTFDTPADDALRLGCHDLLELRHGTRELDCSRGCALLALRRDADTAAPDGSVDGALEVELVRQVGDRMQPLLANVSPVLDEAGSVVDVVHSFRDITRLKEADEAKTMFLATASHELKTPLTVIEGFADVLADGADPASPEFRLAVETISSRAAEMRGLVERLLLTSRIQNGRLDVTTAPLALAGVVTDRASHLTQARGRPLTLTVDDELPDAVAETRAVETVVDHLVENAIKYSPGDSPIEVALTADDHDVVLSVRDRGIGMTADEVERCFDRFWQADGSDQRRYDGSGIGLYLVRSLIDALGGRIGVDSELGAGICFTIALRRADVPPPEDDPPPGGPPTARDGQPSIVREFMRQVGIAALGGGPP